MTGSPLAVGTPLRARLRQWASTGVDLLFPPCCVGCGRAGVRICATCAQRVTPTPQTICECCGRVQPVRIARCDRCIHEGVSPLTRARAAALHTSPLREWIHLFKYEQRPDLAPMLARYLTANLMQPDWAEPAVRIDGVAPVPLHAERRAERGYNQAELLAHGLCRRTGLPLRVDLLERTKLTRSQVGLTAAERHTNVHNAFLASPACRGLHLLLIDDVYTTGATLRACASAALDAGAAQVYALTLALPAHSNDSEAS